MLLPFNDEETDPQSAMPVQASLERIAGHRRILLLQGPNGPFFARLRDLLLGHGCHVTKVNFNGGDDLYYRGGDTVRFSDPMPAWEARLRMLLQPRRIDAIVVFGSARRQHRIAARVARELGIAYWVFEEGYIRPDYITLEAGGVNAESPLASLPLDSIPHAERTTRPCRFRHAFGLMAWHSFWYFVAGWIAQGRYPHYRHHKPFSVPELGRWLRAGYRKIRFHWQERGLRRQLLASDHPHFFMVALQVSGDSQIRQHSPWRRIEDFIEATIQSFASHAPPDSQLVIKHHPMDRGHTNYAATIAASCARYGVAGRVSYLHDARLPSLLHRCIGLVTVNSTTGLQALFHRVPVIALGRCFYAKPGLTFQGSLDAFWSGPPAVDMREFSRFRHYLIRVSQINASFYADHPVSPPNMPAAGPRQFRHLPVRVLSVLCLLMADAYSGRVWSLGGMLDWLAQMVVG
ncbi:capsule biosynthesis protein [Cupriavidus oxalaticus]|nr:Capsule polysaccharide export protein [Cupriavidus oxalaticus]